MFGSSFRGTSKPVPTYRLKFSKMYAFLPKIRTIFSQSIVSDFFIEFYRTCLVCYKLHYACAVAVTSGEKRYSFSHCSIGESRLFRKAAFKKVGFLERRLYSKAAFQKAGFSAPLE
jgi:hypothetical protein